MPCLQPPASLFYGKSTKLLKFALAQDKKKRSMTAFFYFLLFAYLAKPNAFKPWS